MENFNFEITNEIISHGLGEAIPTNLIKIPDVLYHYCGLPVCGEILGGSIWLSHAEYSNDEDEIKLGRSMVVERIQALKLGPHAAFAAALEADFDAVSSVFEVYIWCLSDCGLIQNGFDYVGTSPDGFTVSLSSLPQDKLSQWRAYGADGRGCCIGVQKNAIWAILAGTLRLNPVIYDRNLSYSIIDTFIRRGIASGSSSSTAAALLYLLPLIKHAGFIEEAEWRLLYVQTKGSAPHPSFHSSRDLYAPHHVLSNVLINDPHLNSDQKIINALNSGAQKLDFSSIMIGPSRHKSLNARSIIMKARREGWNSIPVFQSAIPYRS